MINFDKTKETYFLFCVNKKIRKNLQTKKATATRRRLKHWLLHLDSNQD